MNQRVGTCSLCGGDVMGYRGTWLAVVPPPPDECSKCGARRADDTIEMRPSRGNASGYGNFGPYGDGNSQPYS